MICESQGVYMATVGSRPVFFANLPNQIRGGVFGPSADQGWYREFLTEPSLTSIGLQ